MDNQHKKIKGYRDLTEQEIALMNRIKELGEQTKTLLGEIIDLRYKQQHDVCEGLKSPISYQQTNESLRALLNAKDHLQTGQMWFVRALALPDSF
jgi:hypothetical protein